MRLYVSDEVEVMVFGKQRYFVKAFQPFAFSYTGSLYFLHAISRLFMINYATLCTSC